MLLAHRPQAGANGSKGRAGLVAPSNGKVRSDGGGLAGARPRSALGLGLAVCSCPHPHSSWPLPPTVARPSAAWVHRSCTPSIPAVHRHPGWEGWSVWHQLSAAPREPPKHTDGAAESSSATWLPDGAGLPQDRAGSVWSCLDPVRAWIQGCLSRELEGAKLALGCLAQPCSSVCVPCAPAIFPRFSHPAPTSAQGSSPVLHHVHHHPVRGVHRLANQVLEEDEDLHEEVLPGRRRCQELSSTTVPSRGDAVLSTGAGSGPRHPPARALPLWSGDVGCAGVQSRWHQCQVQARHWDWWDAPAEMWDGEAGRCQ